MENAVHSCSAIVLHMVFAACILTLMPFSDAKAQHDDLGSMGAADMGFPTWGELPDSLKTDFERDYKAWGADSAFAHHYAAIGPRAMLDFVEATFERCHGIAHGLGGVIYDELGDLGASLSVCGDRCTNACMHGVIRRAFGSHSFEDVVARAQQICQVEEMEDEGRPGACPHALGHAFVVTSDYSVPQSLEGCEIFPTGFETYRCAMGVFMEYLGMPKERRDKVDGNPWTYNCDDHPKYAVACYRYMLQNQTGKHRLEFDEAVSECLARTGRIKLGCFHGLGLRFSGKVFENPETLSDVCAYGDTDDQIVCIEGIVENMAIHDERKALAACESLSGYLKEICLAAAQGGYYRTDKPTLYLYLP